MKVAFKFGRCFTVSSGQEGRGGRPNCCSKARRRVPQEAFNRRSVSEFILMHLVKEGVRKRESQYSETFLAFF